MCSIPTTHSRRQNTLSSTIFFDKIFQRPPLQPMSTPIGAPLSDLPSGGSLAEKYHPMCPHSPIFNPALKCTCQHVAASEALFCHAPSPTGVFAADEPIQPLHVPCCHRKSPIFPFFSLWPLFLRHFVA